MKQDKEIYLHEDLRSKIFTSIRTRILVVTKRNPPEFFFSSFLTEKGRTYT
jgi:hypothetical protein